ncbi:hypothetical protein BBK36DRAFT_1199189 [Trichoderma citrinoviride]|uniref:Peptidase S8/S53 domain-containing protein n=1 Tax=Trichoderma citrinoviride TaxID=58853 RepID=A0A2T4BCG0_9HYPO|nr:hypothetical protein BBK36DRAFT_1199189 [Trichoderma citrinoviride]PTB67013.1 hypothetical protein BBK36DRAFT_1199189 [Trichoderma citrinoviride]
MDWQETLSPTCTSSTEEFSALGLLTKADTEGRLVELPATPIMEQSPEERLEEQRGMYFTMVQALEHAISNPSIDVLEFWSGHGGIADQIADGRVGNVIHVVAELIRPRQHLLDRAQPIIEKLVKELPQLLVGQNVDGYNPLHLAIRDNPHKLFRLIESVCRANGSEQSAVIKHYFDEALAQPCLVAKRTALHTYFETISSLDFDTADILMKHATDEQLAAQDADGNTPMHYVASFQHCNLEGLKVIKKLIDRDQQIFDKGRGLKQSSFLEVRNAKGYSIYQSLVESMDDERRRGKVQTLNECPLQKTAFQEISLLLKKHYMRTRGHREATSFLYGDNVDDIEISFQYDNLPTSINWIDFTDCFGRNGTCGIKLDNVLQSVRFPRIDINYPDEEHSPREDMTHMFRWLYAKGVRHIISLSVDDSGGPENTVHTSEALQDCLSLFSIERLDWQRIDLALEDIHEAISQWLGRNPHTDKYPLKELCLRWSGNIMALHSWSREEGLLKFQGLEKVYLYKPERHKMCGNEARIKKAIVQFRDEIMKCNPTLEVIVTETVATSDNHRGCRIPPIQTYFDDVDPGCGGKLRQHLRSASNFSLPLINNWRSLSPLFRQKSTSTAGDDVVVAMIGDGVDVMDRALHNQCLTGKSFDYREAEDGDISEVYLPPFVSASDGTVMANLILRVCPMAKIYPIRLPKGGRVLDADSLAKAIEAALAKKATIICLPRIMIPEMTCDRPENERVLRALKRVQQENVLMFCPSATIGIFDAYPKGIFFIGNTCDSSDTRLRGSGQYFILPGLDSIPNTARSSTSQTGFMDGFAQRFADVDCASSNSVSTALATGLSAVIIYMVKLGVMMSHLPQEDNPDIMARVEFAENAAETITRPDVMSRILQGLCPDDSTPDLGNVWHSLLKMRNEVSQRGVLSCQRVLLGITYMILLNHR